MGSHGISHDWDMGYQKILENQMGYIPWDPMTIPRIGILSRWIYGHPERNTITWFILSITSIELLILL
jgi:hypothetical protein